MAAISFTTSFDEPTSQKNTIFLLKEGIVVNDEKGEKKHHILWEDLENKNYVSWKELALGFTVGITAALIMLQRKN